MENRVKVNFEGKEYTYDGRWYDSSFMAPSLELIKKLLDLVPAEKMIAIQKAIADKKRKEIITAHEKFLLSKDLPYNGIRTNKNRRHRTTHCYNCKKPLDNSVDVECNSCGWIICSCGACGCGYSG